MSIGECDPKGYGFGAVLGMKMGIDFNHFRLKVWVLFLQKRVWIPENTSGNGYGPKKGTGKLLILV